MEHPWFWFMATAGLAVVLSVVALILASKRLRAPSTLRRLVSELRLEMADQRAVFDQIEKAWLKFRASETMRAYRDQGVAAASASRSATRARLQGHSGASTELSTWRKERGVPPNPLDWPKWNQQQQARSK